MRRLAAGVVTCGVYVACMGGPAYADRADQLFKKGKKLLAEKRYPEACTAFEESDRIDPGIGAKLNVAKCYQEWGKLATAWRWYTDAESMAKASKDDRARKIHAILVELDASVPRLTVKLPPDASADGVVIKLDGIELAASALGTEQRVDPGPHQIDTIVDGAKQTKVIPVERGSSSEVTLDVAASAKPGKPGKPRVGPGQPPAADDTLRNRRLLAYGSAGGGALLLGIAGIVTLRAHGDYDYALQNHCDGATDMCDDAGLAATHSARNRANIATGLTLLGLAAVGGGLYLYFTMPKAPQTGEHALYLVPQVGSDGGGVVFGGAF